MKRMENNGKIGTRHIYGCCLNLRQRGKKVFIVILLSFTTGLFAQEPIVKKVEIYGVNWSSCYRIPTTVKDIKKRSYYRLVFDGNKSDFDDLFYDYTDCKKLLISQDTIPFRNCPPSYRDDCIVCVKLYFSIRTITIYFRANGDYYFRGKWYKPNYELYYHIFMLFNKDAIMPDEIIEKGKKIVYEKWKLPYKEPCGGSVPQGGSVPNPAPPRS